jgi:hypothetical protein
MTTMVGINAAAVTNAISVHMTAPGFQREEIAIALRYAESAGMRWRATSGRLMFNAQ